MRTRSAAKATISGAAASTAAITRSATLARSIGRNRSAGLLACPQNLQPCPARYVQYPPRMNIHLLLLIVYSVGVVALGLWTARFVRRSSDFFVGGRSLGPGL